MKWLALAIPIVLAATPLRMERMRQDDFRLGGRSPKISHGTGCSQNITCAIQSGDKVGGWWALQTDGTMLSGSALTMVAQGSPSVSPIVLNGSSQWYESDNSYAAPAGDFSFVAVMKATSLVASGNPISKWAPGASYILEITNTGDANWLVRTGAGGTPIVTRAASVSAGAWVGICGTWNNATHTITLRVGGTTVTDSSVVGVLNGTNETIVIGKLSGNAGYQPMSTRGFFFTETEISAATCDRITGGAL